MIVIYLQQKIKEKILVKHFYHWNMLSKILCLDISTQLKLVEKSEFDDLGIRI